jgi:hypothetical protein
MPPLADVPVVEDKALSTQDMYDLLGDDKTDDKVVGDDKTKKEEKVDDKTDDTVEEKVDAEPIEEEPIKLEEEDELEYKDIPKRQLILKEFPELFKKFPGIEHAIYREQRYSEIFPTVGDAESAKATVEDYNKFESSLLSGNLEDILSSVKSSDDKAFSKITSGYLQTLQKVDQTAYFNTINHVVKNTLATVFNAGKQNNDEQLQIAAQLINRFIYQTTNVQPSIGPIANQQQEDPREAELRNREQEFAKNQLNIAVNEVSGRTEGVIKSTIDKHLDPKGLMTPYVKRNAITDIMKEVDKQIGEDTRFKSILDKLWENSFRDGYSEQSKLRIRNALLSKAKTILPEIIQRVKGDALKGQASRSRDAAETTDRKPLAQGRPASNTPSKSDKNSVPRGMKTLDFLMQD